jgi:hypothetical protein
VNRIFVILVGLCGFVSSGAPATDKLSILLEILSSGNDNGPRLDRELCYLSRPEKFEFAQVYAKLPLAHRNGKGLIAFLIGRNAREPFDIHVLRVVLTDQVPGGSSRDGIPILEVTAANPQLVALRALETRARRPRW